MHAEVQKEINRVMKNLKQWSTKHLFLYAI